ncbi:MAG: Ig-like domain-containing protein [Candidatus Gracilibacteria bacterium]|jgi:hypothetical protein
MKKQISKFLASATTILMFLTPYVALASSGQVTVSAVSAQKSNVTVSRTVIQNDGRDSATLQVQLMDAFGTPYPGHAVTLVSSRNNDVIKALSFAGISDRSGKTSFAVSSLDKGVSIFSVIDSTANVVLDQRPQVAFLSSQQYMQDVGGDFNFINVAQAADFGALSQFQISDFPVSIQSGQNVSFKITAQDSSNQTVQDYVGTVHFSAGGDNSNNVSLPVDYTFKASDLGVHQFSLGLSFTSNGTYKVNVNDLSNVLLKGTATVTVGNQGQQGSQQNLSKPLITTPVAGSFSQKNQSITGSAPASYTVKIFDNQQEMGTVQADNTGKFTYQTIPLIDGAHKFYVVALDQNQTIQGTSDPVQITIDTTPPTVDQITLTPADNVKPGQAISLDVLSEENLSQSAAVFNSDIISLNPSLDKPGHYIASIQAPNVAGAYPVDVILVDQLGNEGSYKGKAQVTVTETVTTQESQQTQGTQQTQQGGQFAGRVSGVISYGGDKKVVLVWEALTAPNTVIKHYRVYFGNNASDLKDYADTKDTSTTWYVPNLDNGKQYYFAVTAFDEAGNETSMKSDFVTGIPFASEVSSLPQTAADILNTVNDLHASALDSLETMPRQNDYGPELIWILSGSGLASMTIQKIRRKLKK